MRGGDDRAAAWSSPLRRGAGPGEAEVRRREARTRSLGIGAGLEWRTQRLTYTVADAVALVCRSSPGQLTV